MRILEGLPRAVFLLGYPPRGPRGERAGKRSRERLEGPEKGFPPLEAVRPIRSHAGDPREKRRRYVVVSDLRRLEGPAKKMTDNEHYVN